MCRDKSLALPKIVLFDTFLKSEEFGKKWDVLSNVSVFRNLESGHIPLYLVAGESARVSASEEQSKAPCNAFLSGSLCLQKT